MLYRCADEVESLRKMMADTEKQLVDCLQQIKTLGEEKEQRYQSSGRLVTRLTAYHISRHVASTFKHLTTATTHCDLIKFNNTDGVSSQP
jgi:hypothetical protein